MAAEITGAVPRVQLRRSVADCWHWTRRTFCVETRAGAREIGKFAFPLPLAAHSSSSYAATISRSWSSDTHAAEPGFLPGSCSSSGKAGDFYFWRRRRIYGRCITSLTACLNHERVRACVLLKSPRGSSPDKRPFLSPPATLQLCLLFSPSPFFLSVLRVFPIDYHHSCIL